MIGAPQTVVSGSGDGQNDPFLLSELSEQFTCYSMNPHVIELYGPQDVARADAALERMQAAAGQGTPTSSIT